MSGKVNFFFRWFDFGLRKGVRMGLWKEKNLEGGGRCLEVLGV